MRISYGQDELLLAAVAGTAGTASARRMIEAVLAHAAQRRLITTDWSAVEIRPNFKADWSELCPRIFAITSWTGRGLAGAAEFQMRAVCRVVASRLPAHGLLIVNGDDRSLAEAHLHTPAATVLVGQGTHCDLAAREVSWVAGGLEFKLAEQEFCVPALGQEDLASVLAAAAVGRHLQMSWREIAHALAEGSQPPPCQAGRMEAAGRALVEGSRWVVRGQLVVSDEEPGAGRRLPLARAA